MRFCQNKKNLPLIFKISDNFHFHHFLIWWLLLPCDFLLPSKKCLRCPPSRNKKVHLPPPPWIYIYSPLDFFPTAALFGKPTVRGGGAKKREVHAPRAFSLVYAYALNLAMYCNWCERTANVNKIHTLKWRNNGEKAVPCASWPPPLLPHSLISIIIFCVLLTLFHISP